MGLERSGRFIHHVLWQHRMLLSQAYQCCRHWKTRINPDRWLDTIHGRAFARKVGTDGAVDVDDEHYYIQQALAGQQVVLFVNAPDRTFGVWLEGRVIKSLPRKRPGWPGHGLAGVYGIDQGASPLSRTARAFQAAEDAPALLWHLKFPGRTTLRRSPGMTSSRRGHWGQRAPDPSNYGCAWQGHCLLCMNQLQAPATALRT
jgi:hypothetical protein